MRLALLPLALVLGLAPQRPATGGTVTVGVWYAGPGLRPPSPAAADIEPLRRDLATIRRAGFNAITTWAVWKDVEPTRGTYVLAATERLVAAAAEADLRVSLVAYTEPAPAWAANAPDEAVPFLSYLTKRLSLQPAVIGIARAGRAESPDRIPVLSGAGPTARLAMWSAIARGERSVAFLGLEDPLSSTILSLGETAGVVTRNLALFTALRPRQRGIAGVTAAAGGAPVEVRLLESASALMIIGLNRSPAPVKATIAFDTDIPEAIWQNLETGAAVNFVMGPRGPFLDHLFAPRDALVLMIRKTLR